MRTRISTITIIFPLLAVLITSCGSEPQYPIVSDQPERLNDGIEVGTLAEVSLNEGLAMAVEDINNGILGDVHSILVYKDDKLVLEEYFPGYDYSWDGPNFHGNWVQWGIDRRHNVHSVGKSITSACIGIAIDQGFIESVDQSIFDYLPEHQHLNNAGKDKITIEHLLTMTSGLDWDEWGASYSSDKNDVIALWLSCEDPIACILEKPLIDKPGNSFIYSGGNMILLGEIIKNATGMDIESFSWQYLFDPLGIEKPPWSWINDTGVVYAGGDQRLTPREMLKIGVTYLDGGVWNGNQIISAWWVENSATPFDGPENRWFNHALRPIPPGDGAFGNRGYSYTWWTHAFVYKGQKVNTYWAFGWGGQKIAIFPDHEMVVVLTGSNYTSADATTKIIAEFVIPGLIFPTD